LAGEVFGPRFVVVATGADEVASDDDDLAVASRAERAVAVAYRVTQVERATDHDSLLGHMRKVISAATASQ
jgi:hypothetical protein